MPTLDRDDEKRLDESNIKREELNLPPMRYCTACDEYVSDPDHFNSPECLGYARRMHPYG